MATNPMPAPGEATKVSPIRKGFRSITLYLIVAGASDFMDFVKTVFGAEEKFRVPTADGKIMHAEAVVAGAMIEFGDSNPKFPPAPAALHIYVGDVDAAYARALEAGAKSIAAPTNHDYGERGASVVDPFGNHWYIATRLDSSPAPAGASNLIICLHPEHAAGMIDFMVQGCGAEVAARHDGPGGKVAYAQIRLGNSIIEVSDAHGPYQPMPTSIHYYLPDTDAAYHRAIAAGAKTLHEPRDEAYGDRSAGVTDPFGNCWFFATHIKDVQF
jgi:PhnB protein